MNISFKSRVAAAALSIAVATFSFQSAADQSPDKPSSAETDKQDQVSESGMEGNFHFTDEQGNRRNPTPDELLVASENFQHDMARIAGKNTGKTNEQTHVNGATSATIALSKLSFLVAEENEDGSLTYRHASTDEDGNIVPQSTPNQPEM